jgi:hypothetical protein
MGAWLLSVAIARRRLNHEVAKDTKKRGSATEDAEDTEGRGRKANAGEAAIGGLFIW